MTIEGIPDGWELVRIGKPSINERYIGLAGLVINCVAIPSGEGYAIVRKIEKPRQYRPFANAAEFEPFRDRWIKRTYNGDLSGKGCFKFHAYDDIGVYDVGEHFSYQEMFDDGRQFDDGTPFGIEVTE